jgi:hypothetical protein
MCTAVVDRRELCARCRRFAEVALLAEEGGNQRAIPFDGWKTVMADV